MVKNGIEYGETELKNRRFINMETGRVYRICEGKLYRMEDDGTWKLSTAYKVADMAHYPFI